MLGLISAIVLVVTLTTLSFTAESSALTNSQSDDGRPCALRKYPNGYVCVCNTTYCDELIIERPTTKGEYILITSSASGARFQSQRGQFQLMEQTVSTDEEEEGLLFELDDDAEEEFATKTAECALKLDLIKTYQEILGFGAAFTGAVAASLELLPDELQKTIYRDYYTRDRGIGFNMMRVPIGGCDFDFAPWAYNELPKNDAALSNFTKLNPLDEQKVRQIHALVEASQNKEIKFLGAAWSPPRWMKSNNAWSGLSSLLPQYYATWAQYHLKFLQLMAASNISFWGISTGNEPQNGKFASIFVRFMSLGWTAQEQGIWVNEHLGPLLASSEMRHIKLLVGDDQRFTLPWWPENMNKATNNSAMKYAAGIAVHWYWDKFVPAMLLDRTHAAFPNHFILTSEASIGDKPTEHHGPILGSWARADHYATYMTQNLNHWSVGWVDWNLILDEQGGPSYVSNFVDAPVIVNSTSYHELYKQPIFYVIGHFSKFIQPGCVRVESSVSRGSVLHVAFSCPDQTVTVVLYNKATSAIDVNHKNDVDGTSIKLSLMPKSINTLVYHL